MECQRAKGDPSGNRGRVHKRAIMNGLIGRIHEWMLFTQQIVHNMWFLENAVVGLGLTADQEIVDVLEKHTTHARMMVPYPIWVKYGTWFVWATTWVSTKREYWQRCDNWSKPGACQLAKASCWCIPSGAKSKGHVAQCGCWCWYGRGSWVSMKAGR